MLHSSLKGKKPRKLTGSLWEMGKDPFFLGKTLVLNLRKDSRNKQKNYAPNSILLQQLRYPTCNPSSSRASRYCLRNFKKFANLPQTWLMAGLVRRQAQPKRSIWPKGHNCYFHPWYIQLSHHRWDICSLAFLGTDLATKYPDVSCSWFWWFSPCV